jgi:hypothetical protein
LQGDISKAKTSYQDFLALWKDADPDIPILKQVQSGVREAAVARLRVDQLPIPNLLARLNDRTCRERKNCPTVGLLRRKRIAKVGLAGLFTEWIEY